MKKLQIFSHRERPLANLLRERLAGEGIVCLVRNDELSSALGEIPFVECYPELWVVDDEVWPRAQAAAGEVAGRGGGSRPGMDLSRLWRTA